VPFFDKFCHLLVLFSESKNNSNGRLLSFRRYSQGRAPFNALHKKPFLRARAKGHVTLPSEGVDGDFRILSAEYNVDAKTQVLETVMELGREKPLLADYVFRLKSKKDSLSRHKLARV
jgi:hypothetical protein